MSRIDFDRQHDFATYKGIVARGSDPYFDLCRILTDRGWRDEPATFYDERGMACLMVKSLHACASWNRPNEADKIRHAAQIAQRKQQKGTVS